MGSCSCEPSLSPDSTRNTSCCPTVKMSSGAEHPCASRPYVPSSRGMRGLPDE